MHISLKCSFDANIPHTSQSLPNITMNKYTAFRTFRLRESPVQQDGSQADLITSGIGRSLMAFTKYPVCNSGKHQNVIYDRNIRLTETLDRYLVRHVRVLSLQSSRACKHTSPYTCLIPLMGLLSPGGFCQRKLHQISSLTE
jgi:hypothetical protein